MFFDIYMIIMTGFAILGVYTTIDTIYKMIIYRTMPASITLIKNDENNLTNTYRKFKFVEQTVPNDYTVLFPFDKSDNEDMKKESLYDYINKVLFTNK